ncbi:MAG: flagellar biosynthetic protein FliQ [Puniceicoccaceae bacterium]|nr:MAG: flagellar biosynthetic protein FliQ [Puniceicoccaceae bacterium]
MNLEIAVELFREAVTHALVLVSPILITAIAVGLLVSMLQAVTSLQEQTLSFVPKLFAVGMVLLVAGHWMMTSLMYFAIGLIQRLPEMAR